MSKVGSINVIIGCMFSGKTTELIRNAKRYKSIGKKVLVLNYKMDTRYGDNQIISHDLINEPAYMITSFNDIFQNEQLKKLYYDSEFICINEGQFFKNLKDFCVNGANNDNKIIYVCGLDGDYKQEKFGDMIDLIPVCDSVKKLYSSVYSHINNKDTILMFPEGKINENPSIMNKIRGGAFNFSKEPETPMRIIALKGIDNIWRKNGHPTGSGTIIVKLFDDEYIFDNIEDYRKTVRYVIENYINN